MKTAQEYLLNFSKSQNDNWLKLLIYSAIETNGNISDIKVMEILGEIKNPSSTIPLIPNIKPSSDIQHLKIKKLKHNSGVNALKPKQSINFSDDITILYGLNGVGKSSYFRILNEVTGGNQKKDIIPNIYSKNPLPIDVEIEYTANSNAKKINWNGTQRAFPDLTGCKVFDSSYLNGLLDTRESDQTLIQPLGLSLFGYLSECMETLKSKLDLEANNIRFNKPNVDLKDLSEDISNIFKNHKFDESQKIKIENLYQFSSENESKLNEKKTTLESINQINIQDKINNLNNLKESIEKISNDLQSQNKSIKELINESSNKISDFNQKKDINIKASERFEILKSIPSTETQEWKDFIKAGYDYSTKNKDEKVCPYCRQPLTDQRSVLLIQAYSEFLQDQSQKDLESVTTLISNIERKVEAFIPKIGMNASISNNLRNITINGNPIVNEIDKIISSYEESKEIILKNINLKEIRTTTPIDLSPITKKLQEKIDTLIKEVSDLSIQETQKEERKIKVEKEFKTLMEHKSISVQKDNITKWFNDTNLENSIRKKQSRIRTRAISDLSKDAHNALLTESLKNNLSKELSKLGYDRLNIELKDAGTRKGKSSTKLVIKKDGDIRTILSEGEQKAVALSLFISEIDIQSTKYPIIFDDPVNSLDHKIAGQLASRLIELENQVIIFNHNRLFLDAFETSKNNHVCKTINTVCNNKKGKHIIIYEVISNGMMCKGILTNYKKNDAKNNLNKAKTCLSKSPFKDTITVSALIRISVEHIIDEVVFNHQVPTKYSNKNSRINWPCLKDLNKNTSLINTLERIHSRTSGGGIHNGSECHENPIDVDEFNKMIAELEGILLTSRQC